VLPAAGEESYYQIMVFRGVLNPFSLSPQGHTYNVITLRGNLDFGYTWERFSFLSCLFLLFGAGKLS